MVHESRSPVRKIHLIQRPRRLKCEVVKLTVISRLVGSYVTGAYNAFMDMVLATGPALLIKNLSIGRSTKLGLCPMMGGGWLYVRPFTFLDSPSTTLGNLLRELIHSLKSLVPRPQLLSNSIISKAYLIMLISRFLGLPSRFGTRKWSSSDLKSFYWVVV